MNEFPMRLERESGLPPDAPAVGVGFGLNPILDEAASDKAKRAIYKDVEFVHIVVPGDKQAGVFVRADTRRKCHDGTERDYAERFPLTYQDFKKRGEQPMEGTPLEKWPLVSRSDVMNLKSFHIHTVEALAQVNDSNASKLPFNARDLINKAKQYMLTAKSAAEAEAKDAQIADLQRQINELKETKKKAA